MIRENSDKFNNDSINGYSNFMNLACLNEYLNDAQKQKGKNELCILNLNTKERYNGNKTNIFSDAVLNSQIVGSGIINPKF